MNKLFSFILTVIIFTACEGPMGPQGPQGDPGVYWVTKSFTVNKNEWRLHGDLGELNSYFYADKKLDELSDFVYNKGTVIGYIQTDNKVKNGLPYVLHKGDIDNYGELLWTQTYDFDFYPGGVRFYLTYSDFNTQVRPESETFHIVLMW